MQRWKMKLRREKNYGIKMHGPNKEIGIGEWWRKEKMNQTYAQSSVNCFSKVVRTVTNYSALYWNYYFYYYHLYHSVFGGVFSVQVIVNVKVWKYWTQLSTHVALTHATLISIASIRKGICGRFYVRNFCCCLK